MKKLLDSEKFIEKDKKNSSGRNGLLLNITFWLIIDIAEYLPQLVKNHHKCSLSVKEHIIDKEWGEKGTGNLLKHFDIVLDTCQYSNGECMGSR